jgi:GTP pyrophosphokinase
MAKIRRFSLDKLKPPVQQRPPVELTDIVELLREHGRECDEELLGRIAEFSRSLHGDQRRRSGEPYFNHPLQVAWILADLKFDQTCVAVGLLHDVVEDTLATTETLTERFGTEIAELVDGVTKIGSHAYVRRGDAQAETFRKLVLASARDLRVIVVKLADRLHNMMTLEHLPEGSRRRISRETLEIYAPIAHRLGMSRVQGDLEDLAFFHLHPEEYQQLKTSVSHKIKDAKKTIDTIERQLGEAVSEAGLDAEISFRIKRPFSIYRKLQRQGVDPDQLYDYLAFRIVTESRADCYAALGEVQNHSAWQPIPGRFKDYIAMPKANLYQSLHTTLVRRAGGQPFEVQIRTREMDLVAEEGIAAHWRYKQGKGGDGESGLDVRWLRQLLEWQQEIEDPRTFLTSLKIDLYPDEVYVFTPKGDVLSFPRGATPLDFAYKVHTDVGHHCAGARVNGRLVPLKTRLQNGDRVEIIVNPGRRPSRDWLPLVATSRAKSKIRHWLSTEQKKRAIEIGRRSLEKELVRHKSTLKRFRDHPQLETYLKDEGIANEDTLYARIGFGKVQARRVVGRVLRRDELAVEAEPPGVLRRAVGRILPLGPGPIQVKGQEDMLAFLAKCCNPLPGERIVGYITRGRGVSVHSVDCPNILNLLYDPQREIEVEWARQAESRYPVELDIETEDRPGMLARLTEVIAKHNSNIRQIEADTLETGRGLIRIILEVTNRKHLSKVSHAVRSVDGVLTVERRRSAPTRHKASGSF